MAQTDKDGDYLPPDTIQPAREIEFTVKKDDIDGLGHINNIAYLRYFERVAWEHSCALGLDLEAYRTLDRAMVVRRHEIDYVSPGFSGESLRVATWIIRNDGKATLERAFRLIRSGDLALLAKARTVYTCVALSNGRVRRMPDSFVNLYALTI